MEDHSKDKAEDDREGRYANYFEAGFNAFEFVIDFGQRFDSQSSEPNLHTRIITNPVYARVLENLLTRTLGEYEQKYGLVKKE